MLMALGEHEALSQPQPHDPRLVFGAAWICRQRAYSCPRLPQARGARVNRAFEPSLPAIGLDTCLLWGHGLQAREFAEQNLGRHLDASLEQL